MRIGTRLAALAIAGIMASAWSYAQSPTVRIERDLFSAVNQARRNQGLAPLRWDESLAVEPVPDCGAPERRKNRSLSIRTVGD